MSQYFGIKEVSAPAKALWNYNLQRTLGDGGAFINSSSMNVDEGVTLPIGVLLDVDLVTREAFVVKNGLIVSGGTATKPRIGKNNFFKVGDCVYCSGAAVSITSIDKTNVVYDELTLSASCDGAIAGQYIENSKAVGGNPVIAHVANTILQEKVVDVRGGEPVTAVAWVFQDVDTSQFPVPVSPLQKSTLNATGRFLLY